MVMHTFEIKKIKPPEGFLPCDFSTAKKPSPYETAPAKSLCKIANSFKYYSRSLAEMLRTNTCGELSAKDVDKKVELCGWNHSRRDHGGVIFIDLRDRYGLTQLVFDPEFSSKAKETHKIAERLSSEDVLRASGVVKNRKEGMVNPKLKTGEIEIFVEDIEILSKSEVLPMQVDDNTTASEEVRLKYRYLDLRRGVMQKRFILRHNAAQSAREFLNNHGFLEIETPLLMKHTPEGARDYVVPSRIHKGKFYSLPQSPQLYKQILMVSGFDKYYQFPRCLRDEDLRTDRQPEFTQIDIEMSFCEEKDIYQLGDNLLKHMFKKSLNVDIQTPIQQLSYDDAMRDYGCDKPDLRIPLKLIDITEIAKNSGFSVFENISNLSNNKENRGIVKCINAIDCANFSRKDIDELTSFVAQHGAKGLAWIKINEQGEPDSSIVKHFKKEALDKIVMQCNAKKGDLILFVADKEKVVNTSLAALRLELGRRLNMFNPDEFKFCWITDFPSFEWNDEEERWDAMHHIFTMPKKEHLEFLESDPARVRAQCYDIVLNGIELGSGSIRIHRPDIQERVMNVIGYSKSDAETKFGFLLEAFKYGAPPHGGFAVGFDRITALMNGINDIREVIAFPKTKSAESPMDKSPSEIDENHLRDLGLKIASQESVYERIIGMLKTNHANYKLLEHKAVYTSEESAKLRNTKLEQGAKSLLYNAGHKYILAVLSASENADEKKLSLLAGVRELKLASPQEVNKVTGCTPGAVPPFGNIFSIELYVDKSLAKNNEIAFNAGSHNRSIIMKYLDYEKISSPKLGDFS